MDRKRLSRLAAVVITLAVAAGGCSNVAEEPSVSESTESSAEFSETTTVTSDTQTSLTETTTTVSETDETEVSESSEILSDTEADASETDISEDGEETETEPSETEETTTSRSWSETNSSGTMYIAVDCVGREAADNNSTIITKFQKGDVVEISALTDSGFYKIKGGGYIHSEYLTDNPVSETSVTTAEETAKTTKKTTAKTTEQTTSAETSEIFIDDDDSSTADSSSSAKYTSRYAYNQLSASEKQLYGDIVAAAEKLENAVVIPDGMEKNDALKVYMIVYNEEPQLFWLSSSVTISGSTMTVGYKATSSEIKKMQEEIDANASPVVAKVNGASSDYEKFKIIYEYVVLNNTFSLSSAGYNPSIYNAFTKSGEL
ncbi:MAG: SH3 domain-containing protein, partial [Oscillospiraceae bacterium]